MSFRLRKLFSGAGSLSTYTGRLSQLGLTNGSTLTLTNASERWLNDLTTCPALGLVTLGCRLDMDTTQAVQLNAGGISITDTGYLWGGSPSQRMAAGTSLVINGSVPSGRILGPSFDGSNVSRGTPNDGAGYGAGLNRGIMVMDGGRIEMYGPDNGGLNSTTLSDHAAASQPFLTLVGNCPWKAGDHILVGMSHLLQSLTQTDCTEEYILLSDAVYSSGTNTTSVHLTTNLSYTRWGKLQYGTGSGMSLSNDGYTTANLSGHVAPYLQSDSTARGVYASEITTAITNGRANVIDQRAPVSRITRSVTLSAPADTAFTGDERFGVHTMKMGNTGTYIWDNIEIFNCGQGGALGRYPLHMHLNSIVANTSTIIGPVVAGSHSVTNCSIHKSWNRVVSLHSIHGATFSNNVGWDGRGHMLFLEDGAERLNTIDGNFMYHARDPGGTATTPAPLGYRIKINDAFPAGGWFSNVYNYIRNNHFSDCYVGRWISSADNRGGAYPGGCFGPSSYVDIQPLYEQVLEWDNNASHSNFTYGGRTSGTVFNEQGNTTNARLASTTTNKQGGAFVHSLFTRERLWKNNGSNCGGDSDIANNLNSGNSGTGGYENHVEAPQYEQWQLSDNQGSDLSGAMTYDTGFMHQSVFSARSLNAESAQYTGVLSRVAFASYHALQKFIDNTFIGYQSGNIGTKVDEHYRVVLGDSVTDSWDLYINYPEFIGARNVGQHYIDSVPMWRCPPSWFIRHTSTYSAYAVAGDVPFGGAGGGGGGEGWTSPAIYDADGRLTQSGVPGSYMIFDHPALTTGITSTAVPAQNGVPSLSKYTTTPFYGCLPFQPGNAPYSFPAMATFHDQFTTVRCDPASSLADISGTTVAGDPTFESLGIFGQSGCFVVPRGGAFRMFLQDKPVPAAGDINTGLYMQLTNLRATVATGWSFDDYFFAGLPWPNGTPVSEVFIRRDLGSAGGSYLETYGVGKHSTTSLSKAALLALTGEQFGFYQDTTNNIVWVRIVYPAGVSTPRSPAANYYDDQLFMCLGILK